MISSALSRRGGFTLVEVVVVLVLLGLAFALAAPNYRAPARAPEDALQRVISAARRVAVQRAGAVTVSFETDGRWVVDGGSASGSARLIAGTLTSPYAIPLQLQISPLGACMLNFPRGSQRPIIIDPVQCRIRVR